MKIQVTGETSIDEITVNGGQRPRIIDVTAGLVSSVNGRTGPVTGLAEAADVEAAADEAVAAHVAATDPHGDRAAAENALAAHSSATDPHGDRAWAGGQFLPKGGGTLTGPISGPGTFGVAADGGITAPSLTLPATATTISKSLIVAAPTGAVTYTVWRAPKACTVIAVRGYRVGGTGATINAVKGAVDLLATDLSLSTAATWLSGASVQNTAMAAGDSLAIAIRSITGTPTAITIQVDLQGA
ncbi:hypothetical protein AB0I93_26805 [Streptomyces sp. NPDC049967]|uniref:hypothetical protein n=1 Tax=Streptomyces sp. NPDC049967 TaxID=3155658 RepID=UPI0034140FBE